MQPPLTKELAGQVKPSHSHGNTATKHGSTGIKPSMVIHFKRRISPAAIALSIDFEPFMISNTNALSSFATSGFTHPWMSICLVNQIQSNFKTGLWQTKLGCHVAHRHAHHRSGQQHITDFFSSTT
jgi:hypothetical protein